MRKSTAAIVGAASILCLPSPALAATTVHLELGDVLLDYFPGSLCGFASITDPIGPGDVHVGEIHGGPVFAMSLHPNAPSLDPTASLTLRCIVQAGATGATHAGPDSASAATSGTGTVVLVPTQIHYVAREGTDHYLCTELSVNGSVYYYDTTNGGFSASSSVACGLVIDQEADPAPGLVDTLVDYLFGLVPVPQCRDSVDNDGDGWVDYPNDPDCESADDPLEARLPTPGPAGTAPPDSPSYHCDAGQQVHDGTIGGVLVRLYVLQPSANEVDVCFRVGNQGGKIAITPATPGGPGLPSADTEAEACATTSPPNQVPGPHPVAGGSAAGTPYLFDVYQSGGAVWVCLKADTARHRVIVPVSLPGVPPVPVAYYPDPA